MNTKKISTNPTQSNNKVIRGFLLVMLAVSLLLAFRLLSPFLNTIIMAIVLAALFFPFHKKLSDKFPASPNLVSLFMVSCIFFLIVIPVFFVAMAMVGQGIELTTAIKAWIYAGKLDALIQGETIGKITAMAKEHITFVDWDKIDIQTHLLSFTRAGSEFFITHGAGILGNLALIFTYFFIMMFVLFFILRDGENMVAVIKHLSPLRETQENRIFEKIRSVSRSVLYGSLITSACQGTLGGIAFALVGFPGLFWGTIMAFASIVPVVGIAVIWVPAAGYLLLLGSWKMALFLAIWCALLAGTVDNFLRPHLMKGGAGMSPCYIFLAILGGIQLFGLAGLLYGPLTIAFAMIMLSIYEEEFRFLLLEKDAENPYFPDELNSEPTTYAKKYLRPKSTAGRTKRARVLRKR